jgi:hypothetical protein
MLRIFRYGDCACFVLVFGQITAHVCKPRILATLVEAPCGPMILGLVDCPAVQMSVYSFAGNCLVFVMKTVYILCEVGIEFWYII